MIADFLIEIFKLISFIGFYRQKSSNFWLISLIIGDFLIETLKLTSFSTAEFISDYSAWKGTRNVEFLWMAKYIQTGRIVQQRKNVSTHKNSTLLVQLVSSVSLLSFLLQFFFFFSLFPPLLLSSPLAFGNNNKKSNRNSHNLLLLLLFLLLLLLLFFFFFFFDGTIKCWWKTSGKC